MPLPYLHTDVVFHPNWWNKNYGLTFDRGFFYDPTRRVNQEKQMRELLEAHGAPYDRLAVKCDNIDYGTPDEAIRAMFETVARYRGDRESPIPRAYEVA